MSSDTEDVIDTLFNTLLQSFQRIQETSNERGSEFIRDSVELLEYELHKINIIRAEPYIVSPDWIANKKSTINLKNEKDNKWAITAGLNYNIIKEKQLKKLLNFKRSDTDFPSHKRCENFEKKDNSIAINVLFVSHNSEEIKLILLIINDEAINNYYFAIKNLLELISLGWLQGKKDAIIIIITIIIFKMLYMMH